MPSLVNAALVQAFDAFVAELKLTPAQQCTADELRRAIELHEEYVAKEALEAVELGAAIAEMCTPGGAQ